jgi:hypothetical protein
VAGDAPLDSVASGGSGSLIAKPPVIVSPSKICGIGYCKGGTTSSDKGVTMKKELMSKITRFPRRLFGYFEGE